MRLGSLCTGYGGLDLGLGAVLDVDHVWHAEIDPDASRVLAAHWPDVPNLGDLTTVNWAQVEPVDVLTAGFPCQDISNAGKRAGIKPGTRSGLWRHIAYAISELRPRLVVIENVEGLLSAPADSDVEPCPWCLGDTPSDLVVRALGAVLADLARVGFDAEWATIPASAVGAAHRRKRVFIAAWPAADPPRVGHWHAGPAGGGRVQAAVVAGGARAGGLTLLPTPNTALGRGVGAPSPTLAANRYAQGKRFLDDAVALLPTPRATDGTKGGPNQRGSSGDLMLSSAVTEIRWGQYAPAIARWEQVIGRPAPEPTEPGTKGQPRLSPRLVEWLMGLPAGWVTDHLTRNAALRVLGNGVVPQQAAYAIRSLLESAE